MANVKISTFPLQHQLELISRATVLVSNIGSRSFRLIYLPNGATTILVGPPECTPPRFVSLPVLPICHPALTPPQTRSVCICIDFGMTFSDLSYVATNVCIAFVGSQRD